MNLLILPLCNGKLDTKTDNVRNGNLWQHHQKTIQEHAEPCCCFNNSGSKRILVTDIVHTHQHSRQKCYNNERHDTFAVDSIMDIHTTLRCVVGNEQECLETIEQRTESMQLATLLEVRFDFIYIISQKFHTTIFYFALKLNSYYQHISARNLSKPSRTIRCNSSLEESTNSQRAKSSGATS